MELEQSIFGLFHMMKGYLFSCLFLFEKILQTFW